MEKDCFSKNAVSCDEMQHCKLSLITIFVIHKYDMEMWLFGQIIVFHFQVSIAIFPEQQELTEIRAEL